MERLNFNKEGILDIQDKIKNKLVEVRNEDETKQYFVLPLLEYLGYDTRSNEVRAEYITDKVAQSALKIDYLVNVSNNSVILVECKPLYTELNDEHIGQLWRYYNLFDTTKKDIKCAILTNGDDIWFFTDLKEKNKMDKEPYYKIKLSEAILKEIEELEQYSKRYIINANIHKLAQIKIVETQIKENIYSIYGTLPSLLNNKGSDISKDTVIEHTNYTENNSTSNQSSRKRLKDKEKKISSIELHHEYVYNDYPDTKNKSWKHHTIEYAIIFGTRYNDISWKELLENVIKKLLHLKLTTRELLLNNKKFTDAHKILDKDDFGENVARTYIEEYNIYICTNYNADQIIRFIEELLEFTNNEDSNVIISFKN